MKIYFACSIRGGRCDKEFYFELIKKLQNYGTILTEHLGDENLSEMGEGRPSQDIYTRDIEWLTEADVVVAEVTTPSLGVGYEIGKMENQKPILCLYREQEGKRLSAMIDGNQNIPVRRYQTIEDVEKIFQEFFAGLKN